MEKMMTFNFILTIFIPLITRGTTNASNSPNCIKVILSDLLGDGWGDNAKFMVTINSAATEHKYILNESHTSTNHLLCIDSRNNCTAKFQVISNKAENNIAPWEIAWSLNAVGGNIDIFGFYQTTTTLEYSSINRSWKILKSQNFARDRYHCAAQVGSLDDSCLSESSVFKKFSSTVKNDKGSKVILTLYDSESNGWFLSNGKGTSWYITSDDGYSPIMVGSMNTGKSSQSEVLQLSVGSYQLRVTGALDSLASTHSWQFCGVSGIAGDVLIFKIENDKCIILKYTSYLPNLSTVALAPTLHTIISFGGSISSTSVNDDQSMLADNLSTFKSLIFKSLQDNFHKHSLELKSVNFTQNNENSKFLFEITLSSFFSELFTSTMFVNNEEILRNSMLTSINNAITSLQVLQHHSTSTSSSASASTLKSFKHRHPIATHYNDVELLYLSISEINNISRRKLQLLKEREVSNNEQQDVEINEKDEEDLQTVDSNGYTESDSSTSTTSSNAKKSNSGSGDILINEKVDYSVTMGIVAICGLFLLFILLVLFLSKENISKDSIKLNDESNSNIDQKENKYNDDKFDLSSTDGGDLESSFLDTTSEHSVESMISSDITRLEENTFFKQNNLVSNNLVSLTLSSAYHKYGDPTRNPFAAVE